MGHCWVSAKVQGFLHSLLKRMVRRLVEKRTGKPGILVHLASRGERLLDSVKIATIP